MLVGVVARSADDDVRDRRGRLGEAWESGTIPLTRVEWSNAARRRIPFWETPTPLKADARS
jgi:hypothetical protein